MKKVLLYVCSGILCFASTASAQQFVNGSFEPMKTLGACSDMSLLIFNANMGGIKDVSGSSFMKIANSSCNEGSPVSGSYFGIVRYDPPLGNILVFKLDKPMKSGTEYSVGISYKIPTGAPAADGGFRYGYAADSMSHDSTAGFVGQITSTSWKRDVLKFTPKQNWQYFWVEVSALGGDPFTLHLDSLYMQGLTSVNDVAAVPSFTLAPNPTKGNVTLTTDDALALPYSIQVYDVTGRVILKQEEITSRTANVDLQGAIPGVYIIKLTDAEHRVQTSRLLMQ